LHLNRKNEFDIKVLELLDKIPNYSDREKKEELKCNLILLINYLQDIFTLEWSGIKWEAEKGKLSDKEKNNFTNQHKEHYGTNI
jgi:hypothetical protein